MNDDLISVCTLLNKLMKQPINEVLPEWEELSTETRLAVGKVYIHIKNTIEGMPNLDAERVVRCVRCKHWLNGSYACFVHEPDRDDYCSHGVAVAKNETTTGEDINVPTNGGEKDGHDQ